LAKRTLPIEWGLEKTPPNRKLTLSIWYSKPKDAAQPEFKRITQRNLGNQWGQLKTKNSIERSKKQGFKA